MLSSTNLLTDHRSAENTKFSMGTYLKSSSMVATSSSMELVSTVLGFDVVELWTAPRHNSAELKCAYVHASDEVKRLYPDLITGTGPEHAHGHKLSPRLCDVARDSAERCHWKVFLGGEGSAPSGHASHAPEHVLHELSPELSMPGRTELCYMLSGCGDADNVDVFIVGFSEDVISYKASKLKFLDGIGMAIYIAAFYLDDEDDDVERENAMIERVRSRRKASDTDLDLQHHTGDVTPTTASAAQGLTNSRSGRKRRDSRGAAAAVPAPDLLGSSHGGRSRATTITPSMPNSNNNSRRVSPTRPSAGGSSSATASTDDTAQASAVTGDVRGPGSLTSLMTRSADSDPVHSATGGYEDLPTPQPRGTGTGARNIAMGTASRGGSRIASPSAAEAPQQTNNLAPASAPAAPTRGGANNSRFVPTWPPPYPFSFPVADIPIAGHSLVNSAPAGAASRQPAGESSYPVLPDNLVLERDFRNVSHVANGSNSNVFQGFFRDKLVIIKMIKQEAMADRIAVQEFDCEHGILARINHPNIIRLLGGGNTPRKFIVLEHLDGGSLSTILARNQVTDVTASNLLSTNRFFRRPTFTYTTLLVKSRDIAEALHYLHYTFHKGATVIHRDLKPDNIGFTSAGVLKLFDFGLCTCVQRRKTSTDSYELTGNTGSLRYMAPEVALRKPYTEKVDVYSYGVLVWQMAKDRVPFKGLSRAEFIDKVVVHGERPKIDKSWPKGFSSLLQRCWHVDPAERPSFHTVIKELNALLDEANGKLIHMMNVRNIGSLTGSSVVTTAARSFGNSLSYNDALTPTPMTLVHSQQSATTVNEGVPPPPPQSAMAGDKYKSPESVAGQSSGSGTQTVFKNHSNRHQGGVPTVTSDDSVEIAVTSTVPSPGSALLRKN